MRSGHSMGVVPFGWRRACQLQISLACAHASGSAQLQALAGPRSQLPPAPPGTPVSCAQPRGGGGAHLCPVPSAPPPAPQLFLIANMICCTSAIPVLSGVLDSFGLLTPVFLFVPTSWHERAKAVGARRLPRRLYQALYDVPLAPYLGGASLVFSCVLSIFLTSGAQGAGGGRGRGRACIAVFCFGLAACGVLLLWGVVWGGVGAYRGVRAPSPPRALHSGGAPAHTFSNADPDPRSTAAGARPMPPGSCPSSPAAPPPPLPPCVQCLACRTTTATLRASRQPTPTSPSTSPRTLGESGGRLAAVLPARDRKDCGVGQLAVCEAW